MAVVVVPIEQTNYRGSPIKILVRFLLVHIYKYIKSVPVIFVVDLFYHSDSIIDFEKFLFHIANFSCQKL